MTLKKLRPVLVAGLIAALLLLASQVDAQKSGKADTISPATNVTPIISKVMLDEFVSAYIDGYWQRNGRDSIFVRSFFSQRIGNIPMSGNQYEAVIQEFQKSMKEGLAQLLYIAASAYNAEARKRNEEARKKKPEK